MTKAANDLERLRIRLAPTGTHSNVLLQYYEPLHCTFVYYIKNYVAFVEKGKHCYCYCSIRLTEFF